MGLFPAWEFARGGVLFSLCLADSSLPFLVETAEVVVAAPVAALRAVGLFAAVP